MLRQPVWLILDPIIFHFIDKNYLVQNIFFYVPQKKESHTSLLRREGE